jgi:hypothetical protein
MMVNGYGGMMWALSLPQVAATLAVALTAYQTKNAEGVPLIDEAILNSVLVLLVATSVLGPILTQVYGKRMDAVKEKSELEPPPAADGAPIGEGELGRTPLTPG